MPEHQMTISTDGKNAGKTKPFVLMVIPKQHRTWEKQLPASANLLTVSSMLVSSSASQRIWSRNYRGRRLHTLKKLLRVCTSPNDAGGLQIALYFFSAPLFFARRMWRLARSCFFSRRTFSAGLTSPSAFILRSVRRMLRCSAFNRSIPFHEIQVLPECFP